MNMNGRGLGGEAPSRRDWKTLWDDKKNDIATLSLCSFCTTFSKGSSMPVDVGKVDGKVKTTSAAPVFLRRLSDRHMQFCSQASKTAPNTIIL
jgi:hypothetical protein